MKSARPTDEGLADGAVRLSKQAAPRRMIGDRARLGAKLSSPAASLAQ